MFLNGENLTDRQYIATQTGPVKTLGAPLLVMGDAGGVLSASGRRSTSELAVSDSLESLLSKDRRLVRVMFELE
jgi:hypothetical protein